MDKEQEKFKKAMQMSKIELPFDDFEQRIMDGIAALEKEKEKALSNKKYAITFFLLGTVCGMMLNNYLMAKIQVADIASDLKNYSAIGCQLSFAVLICFFCLQLWRLINMQQKKHYQA
ncbi:MAG: hypothetical protein LBV59_14840 [Sphingobacterium sp.]|jgi:uncharacterized membrane protein YcjF (UPF0283 family)|uniref:hypothetical protein n=2 Tax=unclassified Sphingobacterium TaxID=2609468 RepID=UPI00284C9001|nr:hypothetical protein [Sphingobacterium sp.]MDR3009211.1 hypothetical protein [Sphingobacterium sp.]